MTNAKLIRLSGIPAMLCGLLTAVFWFLHPMAADPKAAHDAAFWAAMQTTTYTAVNGMFVAVLVLCLFGLVGLYARQVERAGVLGLVGFLFGFTGTALFIGAGVFQAFVAPSLAVSEATRPLLEPDGPLFKGPLTPLFAGGGMCFAIGFALFAIATLLAKVLPKRPAILLMLSSPILGLSPMMPYAARAAGSFVFGVAFLWLGWALVKASGEAAKA
jgi:hypothetical protein